MTKPRVSGLPTIERLRELFTVDDKGQLIRLTTINCLNLAGSVAGGTSRGFRVVRVDGQQLTGHRVVFAIARGRWPKRELDHRNGDTLDNRPKNLREVSRSQNSAKRGKQKNNTTGYTGVSLDKQRGGYRASITHNRKHKFLGNFPDPASAHLAWQAAAQKLFGEFAPFNRVQSP